MIIKSIIKFNTHSCSITVEEDGRIHVFKYSDRSCDFDVFWVQDEASDYVLTPPSDCYYRVVIHGDEPESV